ncbi:COMM domain-containing protein 7-like [Rhipicephalus microplus]|uniref:Putative comm domain-containing protein 7 ovary overexpressed n=1 Tax=Rhipicephalus microplus TaxID=6941 RepID=A0A6M2CR12_RHIMP|nr:COMM domain-containing protein 7-like isoform X1 [Rhipicephalus microplus]
MKAEDEKLLGGKPSSAVLADIQAVNALSAEQFSQLVDTACRSSTASASSLGGDGSSKPGSETLTLLLSEASRRGLDAPKLRQSLESLGLDSARAAALADRWFASCAARPQQVRPWQLRDVEWRFGVTVASSSQEPRGSFVQLRLALANGQDVHVEMNLAQFYSLCHEMEQAKLTLEALR